MRSAFDSIDIIGERVGLFGITIVVLQSHLDSHAVPLAGQIDGVWMQRRFPLIQVLDKRADAAIIFKLLLPTRARIVEPNAQAAIQKRELLQARRQRVIAELKGLEDLGIGIEGNLGPTAAGLAGRAHSAGYRRGHHDRSPPPATPTGR